MGKFDINLILDLQKALRCPFLDWFFYIVSFLGSEYCFLAVAAILLWCVNKRYAFQFVNIFCLGQLCVGVLKTAIKRPRPFDNGAASVIKKTSGYSFPSGHAHSIANFSGQLYLGLKRRRNELGLFGFFATKPVNYSVFAPCLNNNIEGEGSLKSAEETESSVDLNGSKISPSAPSASSTSSVAATTFGDRIIAKIAPLYFVIVAAFLCLLVMLSRMYLGQHYLTDVLHGAVLGILISVGFTYLYKLLGQKDELLFVVILPLTVVVAAVLIGIGKNSEDAVKILGVYGAATLGYFLERRLVGYKEKSGGVIKQIAKLAVGFLALILIKEGLGAFSDAISNLRAQMFVDYLRYFLIGMAATLGAPTFFKMMGL